jgi:hypothetical protein
LGQGRVSIPLLTLTEVPDAPSTTGLDYTVITGRPPPPIKVQSQVEVCAQLLHYRGNKLLKAETELNCVSITPTEQ